METPKKSKNVEEFPVFDGLWSFSRPKKTEDPMVLEHEEGHKSLVKEVIWLWVPNGYLLSRGQNSCLKGFLRVTGGYRVLTHINIRKLVQRIYGFDHNSFFEEDDHVS